MGARLGSSGSRYSRILIIPPRLRHSRLASVLLCATAVVVVATVVQAIALRASSGSVPLEVSSFTATANEERGVEASVTVTNNENHAAEGKVGWLLATPGKGPEWDRRAYQSSVRSVTVPAGESATVRWSEAALLPPGSYVASAWAHVPGPGGYVPSDSRVQGLLRFRATDGPLLRAAPPRFDVRGVDLRASVSGGHPRRLDAVVTVTNDADASRRVIVRVELSAVRNGGDPFWWRAPALWSSRPTPMQLEARQTSETKFAEPVAIPAGTYVVRAVVEDLTPDVDGPLDELALAAPVVTDGSQ